MIGLDGLEPTIVDALLAEGALPNLARLRASGDYARVGTTNPAQTPVAWSTFATGLNPGGHGIFDFIRRDPLTYLPDLALNRYEQKNAFSQPAAVNLRSGTPVWERLSQAGIPSTILRCPCTYPAAPLRGKLLAGMGVPDLRGGLGTSTFFTTQASIQAGEAEIVVPLKRQGDGSVTGPLVGPRNPKDRTDIELPLVIRPDLARGCAVIAVQGVAGKLEVALGRWSDWMSVGFKLGMLRTARGLVRFHLVRLEPEVELLASPINFDPDAPLFPISAPGEYVRDLANEIGVFHTTGMVEDHAALSNGRLDEAGFLRQCEDAWSEREAMMVHELDRLDSGLCYCLFDTSDRVQHMFWRFREPDHPANLGRPVPTGFARVVADQYRRADAVVGQALARADDKTLVIALSDHGFNSFRRGVNLNTWLHEQGLLALKPGVEPSEEAGDFFRSVDWSRTKAYALGLGGIYLNLAGRERDGIVKADDAQPLKTQIATALSGLPDPRDGKTAIRSVHPREAVYRGPRIGEAPDLLVNFNSGFRASWGTSLGGVPAGIVEDNVKPWSGDHIIDPSLVPGVLFMNRPFKTANPRLEDLAPTILAALGAEVHPELEGSPLLP